MIDRYKEEMIQRLTFFAKRGIDLYIEGKLSTPEEVAERYFVSEDCVYMPDYVVSDQGKLKEVRYDKIKEI